MNYNIKLKKLGNHWYVDLIHQDPSQITLNERIERFLNFIDKEKTGELSVVLQENYSLVYSNSLFINEDDLLRYFTTSDDLEMRFLVGDREFQISSDLYYLIEEQYNPNFHKYLYSLEICNWTI